MAPLPPESTARYFVDYIQGTVEHTLMVRVGPSVALSEFDPVMMNVFSTLAPLVVTTLISGVRYAAIGQPFSNPVPSELAGDYFGTGAPTPEQMASYIDFVGRSPTGRRARLTFFGVDAGLSGFRYTPQEHAAIGTLVNTFNDALNIFLAIDGSKPTFKNYGNTGIHAYWTKELRS